MADEIEDNQVWRVLRETNEGYGKLEIITVTTSRLEMGQEEEKFARSWRNLQLWRGPD